MEKRILFSVTKDDCEWSYTKGTGAGGQKRNKTSSAVHCKHVPSGAKGYSESSRSQHDNKRDAFLKMIETPAFKKWHGLEIMRRSGEMMIIEENVRKSLTKTKTEVKVDGKWSEVSDLSQLT